MLSKPELLEAVRRPEFPLSGQHDPAWQIENAMGPNVLWLAEFLSNKLAIQASHRVLDLGSGKCLSSVFLAKEFGCQVWAADLWTDVKANENLVNKAGVTDLVHPVSAEAHNLPFEPDFFDLIVSFDAYHYFGTDDLYIGYITKFLKRGGSVGVVSPGLIREFDGDPPVHLQRDWYWDMWAFHSSEWWRRHIEKSGLVRLDGVGMVPNGWRLWSDWDRICDLYNDPASEPGDWVEEDAGRNLGFVWWVAKRHAMPAHERWLS